MRSAEPFVALRSASLVGDEAQQFGCIQESFFGKISNVIWKNSNLDLGKFSQLNFRDQEVAQPSQSSALLRDGSRWSLSRRGYTEYTHVAHSDWSGGSIDATRECRQTRCRTILLRKTLG